jgi:Ca-activated chloride channel homolog
MIDELDQLKVALKSATPVPDAIVRERTFALAQDNFMALQEETNTARLHNTCGAQGEGVFTTVKQVFTNFNVRFGIFASSGLAIIGVGIIVVLPESTKSNLFDYLRYNSESLKLSDSTEVLAEKNTVVDVEETLSAQTDYKLSEDLVNLGKPNVNQIVKPSILALKTRKFSLKMDKPSIDILAYDSRGELELTKKSKSITIKSLSAPSNKSEYFANNKSNPLKIVSENPVSTFSIDVDTASYSFVRSSILNDRLPHPDSVRVEEMINYFSYDYSDPKIKDVPFFTTVAVVQTPWNIDTKLVRVGIQGKNVSVEERPGLDLVFLIDTSGSMENYKKLPLLKKSFPLLLAQLKPTDRVSIVTYAGSSGVALEPTPASERATILTRLEALHSGGSTAGHEGLQLAYRQAEKMQGEGRVRRVILATDGDFNVGFSDRDELKRYVEEKRNNGVYLSVLGFGQRNYNDGLMQALAQNGNGFSAHIDSLSEAMKVLVDQVSGTLVTIANDVKIQVEFNPAEVAEYRLIGYETRALAREDFKNDKVDSGDIGAGHTVTALYEITPVGSPAQKFDKLRYKTVKDIEKSEELGFLKLRYKLPGEKESRLIETPILESKSETTSDANFSAAIAGFGQLLRGDTKYLGNWSYADAVALAESGKGDDKFGYRAEAIKLIQRALTIYVEPE